HALAFPTRRSSDLVRVPAARQQVELRAVVVGCVVEPVVPTGGVVGVKAVRSVAPSDATADDVTDAGLAAADLEPRAVSIGGYGPPGARMAVGVRPAGFDAQRVFLGDGIPPLRGVAPGAAAAVEGGGPLP